MGSLRSTVAPPSLRRLARRGVHLLLGGVILIPYVLLIVGFVQLFTEPGVPYAPVIVLATVTFLIGTVPPFLPAMRALEITAARNLLDVDLPDPVADPPWETRLFGAGWYLLHLLCGGAAITALLVGAPMAVMLVAHGLGAGEGWSDTLSLAPLDALPGGWAVAAGLGLVVATALLVAGLGALLARFAPLLLGPSPAELRLAMEAQAEEFAERNRLARELHDSVGHALTVTTLQAAAARRVLDTDPEFARRALLAVEDAGRAAMADLDHVLGLLRTGGTDAGTDAGASPTRTLADLDRLIDDTRTTGMQLDATVDGDLAAVPPALSREAYRIVQEGLTNAARHGGPVPVRLRVAATPSGLDIDVSNPLPAGSVPERVTGGRGLRGMRERVRLLRGELSAQAADGVWQVRVHLPARAGDRR